jgi:acyl-CoA synthetase (AMP-forming)/AMP-acid ligase II
LNGTSEETGTNEPSLLNLLLHHPLSDDETLVYSEGRSFSAAEFREASAQLASMIIDAGVERGSVVAAIVEGGAHPLIAMYATWLAGAVYMPCNARLTDSEIKHMLDEVAPALVIGPPARLDTIDVRAGRIDESDDLDWKATAPAVKTAAGYDADVALIMTTSGTTGRPKAVLLRHSGTLAGFDAILDRFRATSSAGPRARQNPTPNLIPVSLALWAGIYNTLFAFRVGASVVLLGRFSTSAFVATIRQFNIRSTVLAPAMINMLNDDPEVTDLAPLRFVRSITAPLRKEEAERFFVQFGIPVLNSYGQTELGGEVVGWSASDVRTFGSSKLGSAGRPHGGIDVKIRDPEGAVLDTGESGEIWVRSPFVMRGYANSSDSMDGRLVDGYLRTGDLGHIDSDGFLWVHGRETDLINRGGLKVSPEEVEEVLRSHPSVSDACVAGVADPRLGEVPYAWIVPARDFDPAALEAWCRQKLAPYKVPVGFSVIDEIPRSEIGKVLRNSLAVDLADGHRGAVPLER